MAAVTTAVVAAGATVYASNKSSSAAKKGAQATTQAASDSNALQQRMYDQSRADNEPFRQNAMAAQNEYMRLLGLDPNPAQPANYAQAYAASYDPAAAYLAANPDVAADPYYGANPEIHYQRLGQREGRQWQATNPNASAQTTPAQPYDTAAAQQAAFAKFRANPGYQFGFTEGQRALDSGAAARGGLYSGAAGKALQRYGNDYADQQGFTPYMNRLAALGGMGQTVNSQNAALGQNLANSVSQNNQLAAASRASSLQQQAQAQGQMAQQLGQIGAWYIGQRNPNNTWGWGGV